MNKKVLEQLSQARDSLLDLTLRNRLLNYRPTKRTTIQVIDELPDEIWRLLVNEAKSLSFLAREEYEVFEHSQALAPVATDTPPLTEETNSEGTDQQFILPAIQSALDSPEQTLPKRYTDLFLQTLLDGPNLQTNLLRIYQTATSYLEERGVNCLFLSLGVLEWHEPEDSQRTFKAPLLLIPVKLERTSAKRRFKLSASGDDPVFNPCLVAKLQKDFGTDLPCLPDDLEDFSTEAFFGQLMQTVSTQANWKFHGEVYLGLFSFTKYLMYVDLDNDRWSEGNGLLDNALLRGLCGDETAVQQDLSSLPSPEDFDETLVPEDTYQILDADSSQQQAILAAKLGKSIVIEGPPGTGKSQTIANIIAECIADGKSVLFVSEKMAALEVVKRRLDGVGLGEFCLELHSTKANRKAFAAELQQCLTAGRIQTPQTKSDANKLLKLRQQLNTYADDLHTPFGPADIVPYQAMGRVALLEQIPDLVCDMPGYESWNSEQIEEQKEIIQQLTASLSDVWPPEEHPWAGARIASVDMPLIQRISQSLEKLITATSDVLTANASMASVLGGLTPTTAQDTRGILEAGKLIQDSPGIDNHLLSSDLWDEIPHELSEFLRHAKRAADLHQQVASHYKTDALNSYDWASLRDRYLGYRSLSRFFKPGYWADRRIVKEALTPGYRPNNTQIVTDLDVLADLGKGRKLLHSSTEIADKYFGNLWPGHEEGWQKIKKLAFCLKTLRKYCKAGLIGDNGLQLSEKGANRQSITTPLRELQSNLHRWEQAWTELAELAELQEPGTFENTIPQTEWTEIQNRLKRMADNTESLHEWARYQDLLQTCESSSLAEFIQKALSEALQPDEIPLAMKKQHLRLVLSDVFEKRPALRQFRGSDHQQTQLQFARTDKKWLARTAVRLRAKLGTDKPGGHFQAAGSSKLGILQGELRRKRGGRSIRRILSDAGDVVQKLKPCFMMSPLSVAQFLALQGLRFDVIVFDEASQVEPADSLGAIARSKQLILVGDPKQLPPTSFFNHIGDETPAASGDGAAGLADMESILDRGAMTLPTLRLRWHYRSRHESLITFSNHNFYDNDLVVFPSSFSSTEGLGLSMVYNPTDSYDRGKSQTNRSQAKRIAEWVFQHARQHPEKSLGIGAFSQRQQQAILDQIEMLRQQDDSLEEFFDRNRPEPFFVKNLETIQGDERDVILLSVGYGKRTPEERLSMNFGPLNKDGGWRRLNVLVTRARQRCVVFSSIRAEDFDLSATSARGVHALRQYLQYAATGQITQIKVGEGEFDSPFEKAVYNALTENGLTVHKQIGCVGYAIDLAIVDPEHPGKYLLGIECDGASYHSSATARDRDRLRQQVLEGLGWRIHRAWSTDWFRTPQKEVQKILDAVERARTGAYSQQFIADGVPPQTTTEFEKASANQLPIPVEPYTYHDVNVGQTEDFYVESIDVIRGIVVDVAKLEGPIHIDELTRRTAEAWGFRQSGSRIRNRISSAIDAGIRKELLRITDEFVWPADMTTPPVRQRDSQRTKSINLICLEEIGRAACLLLKAQFGMNHQDLITQTCRILGFGNTGERIVERITTAIEREIASGRIASDGNSILKAVDDQLA